MTQDTNQQIQTYMTDLGVKARKASAVLSAVESKIKNDALNAIADELVAQTATLKTENAKDLQAGKEKGLDTAMIDRLAMTDESISLMAEGLRQISALSDPIGEITDLKYMPTGIQVGQMRVPLGVIGIIYESRPNVTADAAALCLKSGNATILRGGSEAIHSNTAVASCIQAGLSKVGLPAECVQVVETTDREAVGELLRLKDYVDVIIPRGGKSLIERVSNDSLIPVI
ncbi:MAG: glutamate-5-semialdehyde dehydrogenase, partial [Cocleimonas sp.]